MIRYLFLDAMFRTSDGETSLETDGGECTLQKGKQLETQHEVQG